MGDTSHYSNSIGINTYWGSIVPHEKALNPLKKDYAKSVEISYAINRHNDKSWHRCYNYPEVGISYMFMDLGYSSVLGYSHSVYPYIHFSFINQEKRFNANLGVAFGLSYFPKTFDSLLNRENIAISSHINFYASVSFNLRYRLSNRISANIGVNASHFSNGSYKKPNYGLNILAASSGVSYSFHNSYKQTKSFKLLDNDTTRLLITFNGGLKETNDYGDAKYGVGSLSLEYSKSIKTVFRYGGTIDFMYDGSTLVHFRDDSVLYQSKWKASKLGISFAGEMVLYRLSVIAGLGIYLYNQDKQNDLIYQRIGLRYRLSKLFYSQIILKSHLNVADYFELGIGCKIR